MLLCAVMASVCVHASIVISINSKTDGSYSAVSKVGNKGFTEPTVMVQSVLTDEGGKTTYTDVTGQYKITYSMLGGEGLATEGATSINDRGAQVVVDAATGSSVEIYYGNVVLGKAGTVRVKVTATLKADETQTYESYYDIDIDNIAAEQTFTPAFSAPLTEGHDGSVTLVTKRLSDGYGQYYMSSASTALPSYKVTTDENGVTTDITDYYDVTISYVGSDKMIYDATKGSVSYRGMGDQWSSMTEEALNTALAELGNPEGTLTYTFMPKAEYAGYYATITRTIDVRLISSTTEEKQSLHLSLTRDHILQETVSNHDGDNMPEIHVYKYGTSDIDPNNHYQYATPIPSLLTENGARLFINTQRGGGSWGDFQLVYQIVKDSTYYDDCRYMPFQGVSLDDPNIVQAAGEPTGFSISDYQYQVAKPGLVKVAVYAVLSGTPDDNGYGAQYKSLYQPLLDGDDNPVTVRDSYGNSYTAYTEPAYFYVDVMKRQPHLVFSPNPQDIVFVKGDKINIPTRFDVSAYIDDSHNGEEATLIWGADIAGNDHFAYSFFISDRNANFIKLNDWPYANGQEAWEAAGGDIYSYRYRHVVLDNYNSEYTGVAEIVVGDSIKVGSEYVVVTAENIETLKETHPYIQQGDYEWGIVYNSMKGFGNESWTMEFLKTGQYNIPYTVRPWNHTRWDNSTEIGVRFNYSEDDLAPTKILLGYEFQVVDKGQDPFEEPETKVVVPAWNNYDVTEYFDLEYEIDSDVNATGTTIDPATGEVIIGSDNTGDVRIKVTGTRKSVGINYANPEPAYYTIRIVDPANRAKWEVISTCKTDGCEEHVTTPRFVDMTEANGRMHFLTAGEIYGGTVIEGVPGISMTIGAPLEDASSAADWLTVATAESTPKCCQHETSSVIVRSDALLELDDDGVPTAGAFYQFNPTVNGYLSVDAKFYKDNTIILITRDANGVCYKDVFTNVGDNSIVYPKATYDAENNLLGDYTFPIPLIAGETYYLYDITDGGKLNLHGFSYQPAFIFNRSTTQAQSEAPLHASLFMNGLSNGVPVLYNGNNERVSFVVSDAYSEGVTPADYITVMAEGELDPQKMTIDDEDKIFKLRVTATVTSSDASLGACVSKTPYYDVQVIDIPSFVIGNQEEFEALNLQVGSTVTTTNISTDITMTFGGWHDSDNTFNSTKSDSWKYQDNPNAADRIGSERPSTDTYEQRKQYYNRTIDGFEYFTGAANDPVDEKNISILPKSVYTFASGAEYENNDDTRKKYNSTYRIPCRGAYMKFEPRESGTLIVYLVQNGSVDYHYGVVDDAANTSKKYWQMKWRPLFITDETGRPVTMVNSFGNVSKYLPTGEDNNNAGSFTLGISRCNKYEDAIKNAWGYGSANEGALESGCSFDWSNFKGTEEDRANLLRAWPDKGERESIIRLASGGFVLPHKAYVRYSFHVKAGKTYYVFQSGSKPELGGFSFVPTGFPDECKYAITSKPGALVYNDTNQEKNYAGETADVADLTFTWESADNFNVAKENIHVTINDRRKSELTSATDKDVLKARTFTAGKWEGLCLPFSVSTQEMKRVFGEDYALVTFDGLTDDDVLHFVRHANTYLEAGRPYLVKPSKDGVMDFHNVSIEGDQTVSTLAGGTLLVTDPSRFDVSIDNGDYTFKGIYMRETMPAYSFFAKDDGLYCYNADTKIGGYRAYLRRNTDSGAGAKAVAFTIEDLYELNESEEQTTGLLLIGEDAITELAADTAVYNINGQRIGTGAKAVNSAPHGIYIIGGRKIVR